MRSDDERIPTTLLLLIVLVMLILVIKPYEIDTSLSTITGHATHEASSNNFQSFSIDSIEDLKEDLTKEYSETKDYVQEIVQRSRKMGVDEFIITALLFEKEGYFTLENSDIDQVIGSFKTSYDYFFDLKKAEQNATIDAIFSHFAGFDSIRKAQFSLGSTYNTYIHGLSNPRKIADDVTRIFIYAHIFKDLYEGKKLSSPDEYLSFIMLNYGFDPTLSEYVTPFVAQSHYGYTFKKQYSFDEYQKIKQGVSILLEECRDLDNLDWCIKNSLQRFNSVDPSSGIALEQSQASFEWDTGAACFDQSHEASFFMQMQSLNRCANSFDVDCICPLQGFDEVVLAGRSHHPRLRLIDGLTQVTAHSQIAGFREYHVIENVSLDQPELILVDGGILLSETRSELVSGVPNEFLSGADLKELMRDAGLENVDYETKTFGKISKDRLGHVDSQRYCELKPKTTFIFCVKSDNELYTFDDYTGSYDAKPITYRFAISFVSDVSDPLSFGSITTSQHPDPNNHDQYLIITTNVPRSYGSSSSTSLISKVGGVIR